MKLRAPALIVFVVVIASHVTAQTFPTTPTPPATGQPSTGSSQPAPPIGPQAPPGSPPPVPYAPAEFPTWLRELRRAEIITVGAFPLTLLFSSLGYPVYRYVSSGFEAQYAPGTFGSASSPLSLQDRYTVLATSVVLAATVALADFVISRLFPAPSPQAGP